MARIPKSAFGCTLAAALALAAAGPAGAATHPAGGSTFDAGAEGWQSTAATCAFAGLSLCTQANAHSASEGNPPGSLGATTQVVANVVGLFEGTSTWRSPSFSPAQEDGGGSLEYDRRLAVAGIATLDPSARVRAVLVNETGGSEQVLASETLTTADAAWAARDVALPAGTLTPSSTYHLELRSVTTTETAQAGVLGSATVGFDNVALTLADGAGQGTGGGFPRVAGRPSSVGVLLTGPSLSSIAFRALVSRVDYTAEVGRRAGGSVIPRSRCTIVGTRKSDRIVGTRGNDVICGLGGNDRISGGGGRDLIDGGSGNDRLSGGAGADVLIGLRGRDRENGGKGNDRIGGGRGRDVINAGAGRDRAHGGSGSDIARGGSGADRLAGGRGRDRLSGGPGNDRLLARDRTRDLVSGGSGRDRASVYRLRGRHADRRRGVERATR